MEGFVITNEGEWKIIKKVKLDYKPVEIEFAGEWMAIGKVGEEKTTFSFWNPKIKR